MDRFHLTTLKYDATYDRLIAAGDAVLDGKHRFALVSFRADGNRDTSWDYDGKVLVDFAQTPSESAPRIDMANGKLWLVGSDQLENGDVARSLPVARLWFESGRAGEPCKSDVCDTGLTCGSSGPSGATYKVCKTVANPPPPSSTGGNGERCNSDGSCDSTSLRCHSGYCGPIQQGDSCFPDGNSCGSASLTCILGQCSVNVAGACNQLNEACCIDRNITSCRKTWCNNGFVCSHDYADGICVEESAPECI
jgi:hypothetical protein